MIEISVSKFRAELKRWLDRAQRGEELVITDHGKPVARVVGAERLSALERLTREGIITPPRTSSVPDTSKVRRVKARGTVSDLISEQRR